MAKKKTVGARVTSLEDRETILYEYIDELRAQSKKLDRQHEEVLERIRQNEEGLRAQRELAQALGILQGEALQMIKELTTRTNGHEDRLRNARL